MAALLEKLPVVLQWFLLCIGLSLGSLLIWWALAGKDANG